MNLQGILTWAFEFEDQPFFAGFRTLATNGVDKPVLNAFRMAGLMRGDQVPATSTGAVPADSILRSGVRQQADIDVLAARSSDILSVMIWNYRDDDLTGPDVNIEATLTGLPMTARRGLITHFRIDQTHSNAYTFWKGMGSPQHASPDVYSKLERAGQLELLHSPQWLAARDGEVHLKFTLPSQAISLVQLSW
jgi:xylan 1,4-beta-xylosidase